MGPRDSLHEQLTGWLASRTRGFWAAAAGLLVLTAIAWQVLAHRTTANDRITLQTGRSFTLAEFHQVQASWRTAGLNAARFDGGLITVPASDADRYLQTLGAPGGGPSGSHWADAWQTANDRLSQFSGQRERQDAREISRAQTVSRLLEQLPDIRSADVVWDESPSPGWRTPGRARATVYLHAAEGRSISPEVVDAVRRAVSGSKANLAPTDVAVMDQTRMVTYDGASANAASARAVQLAAAYRARLEAALQHFPGITVTVQADPAPVERSHPVAAESTTVAAPAEIPVVVAVSVPEATIRILAGLQAQREGDATESSPTLASREVFQAVEGHVYETIRAKAALLVPTGLSLSLQDRLHIETIPTVVVAGQAAPKSEPLLSSGFTRENLPAWIALICGLGALWMLRPRDVSKRNAADTAELSSSQNGDDTQMSRTQQASGEIIAIPHPRLATLESEVEAPSDVTSATPPAHSLPLESHLNPQLPTAPVGAAIADGEGPDEGTLTPAIKQARPRQVVAQRRNGASPGVLQDVLSRLESAERGDQSPVSLENGSEALRTPGHRLPTLTSDRTPPRTREFPPADTNALDDIEQLAGEPPQLLEQIVAAVDAITWSQALFGTSRSLQAQLLPHFTPTEAEQLTRALRAPRPVRLREIDTAQHRIREAWRQLRQDLPLAEGGSAGTAGEYASEGMPH